MVAWLDAAPAEATMTLRSGRLVSEQPGGAGVARAGSTRCEHFAQVEHRPDGSYELAVWSDVDQNTRILRLTGATPAAEDVPAAATAQLDQSGWRVLHPWIRRGDTWRTVITRDPTNQPGG